MNHIHMKVRTRLSPEISIRGETAAVRQLLENTNIQHVGIETPTQTPLEARFGVGLIAQFLNQISTEGIGEVVPVKRKYLKHIAEKLEDAADSI